MSTHEYMEVGYLRSNCLNKVSGLFMDKIISSLKVERSRQEKGQQISPYPWVKWYLTGKGHFYLEWDMWKHSASFDIVANTILEFKKEFKLQDFVVEHIQVGFTNDKKLCDIINQAIPTKDTIKSVDENTRIFVTFVNTPLAYTTLMLDGQSDLIQKINESAIVNLRFKKGVMDLKSVMIEQKRKAYDDCNFLIHNTSFIERILKSLNTKEWYALPEIKEIPEHPTPCAIRTYEMKENKKWTFVKDREIKYENHNI